MAVRWRCVVGLIISCLFLTSTTSRSFGPTSSGSIKGQPEAAGGQEPVGVIEDSEKLQRLFARAHNAASRKTNTSLYEIVEYEDEKPPSPQATLRRKLRKAAERRRPVSETFPDEDEERKMKRFARKAVTQLLNLASAKQWKDEQEQLANQRPLPSSDGMPLLGYKKDPKTEKRLARQRLVKATETQRKGKKRSPKDEVIKRYGELLRDKAEVKRIVRALEGGSPLLKLIRRTNKKWARRFEREEMQAAAKAEATDSADPTSGETAGDRSSGVTVKEKKGRKTLRLKGGGGLDGFATYLPTSYPSILHWLFAMGKLILQVVLRKLGLSKASSSSSSSSSTTSGGGGGGKSKSGGAGGAKGGKGPVQAAVMPESAVAALASASFRSDRIEPLAKRTVIVVTNNCIFTEEDIVKTFNNGKNASVPKIIPGALPSLLKLAQTTNLHLITQFPHSSHDDLTPFIEARVVPSKRSVHGEWAIDAPEKKILKALDKAGVFAAGMHNTRQCLFCESTDGRGFMARTVSENADSGPLALHVDDRTESVEWLQNVLSNTTVVGIRTLQNNGKFSRPKRGAPAEVVGSLAAYFEEEK